MGQPARGNTPHSRRPTCAGPPVHFFAAVTHTRASAHPPRLRLQGTPRSSPCPTTVSEADPAVPAFEIWDGRVRRVTSIWPEPFLQNLGARPLQLAQATLGPAGPPCLHVRQLRLTPACIGCRLCRIQAMLCLLLPAHMVQAASIFTPRSRCCLGPPMLGATCCLSSRATQG